MSGHRDPDKDTDSGSGGSAGSDGSDPTKHGNEGFPTQSGDGKDPGR
ncbi:hypothetical protein ACFVWN_01435 [Nocardiopsis flavescens]